MISLKNLLLLLIASLLFTSCTEANDADNKKISETYITDVNDAYMRWSGTKPTADVHMEKAQYWQSSHFTNEYILYFKLKPDTKWWSQFTEQNSLEIKNNEWIDSKDTPEWFTPSQNCIQHGPRDFDQGSRYFRDTLTEECFIYEVQL
jgi:hypothetical protein